MSQQNPNSSSQSGSSSQSKKTNFFTGLVTGIAIISTIGFIVLLATGLSKQTPSSNNNDTSNSQPSKPTNKETSQLKITVQETDHIRGNKDAPITLIEFSDFQCPYCKRFHPTMQKILKEFEGKVRWVYRHFPLAFHQNAQKAAEATECAAEQNKFWEYADKLFENSQGDGTGLNIEDLQKYAQELNFNINQFNECLTSGKTANRIKIDIESGKAAGVSGTPTTVILDQKGNTQKISGALPYDQVKAQIEAFLK